MPRSAARSFAPELLAPIQLWRIWALMGHRDIQLRYKRSLIGPFWITLSLVAWIIGISTLYSQIFGRPLGDYMSYLACGIFVWNFISANISEGGTCVIDGGGHLKNIKLPYTVLVARVVYRNLLVSAHSAIAIVGIILVFNHALPWTAALLAIPGMLVVALICYLAVTISAPLTARFRDLQQITQNVMQIAFFLTPIIWAPELSAHSVHRAVFVHFNPFFHLIEMVRAPLLGAPPGRETLIAVGGMTIVAAALAAVTVGFVRRRIFQWL